MKNQKHLGRPTADAADGHQLFDDGLVVHALPQRHMHLASLKMRRQVTQVLDFAAGQTCQTHDFHAQRQDAVGQHAIRVAGHQIDKAVPHRLRGFDRNLLADDGSRQRGERIAAAFQATFAQRGDQFAQHPVSLGEVLAGFFPIARRFQGDACTHAFIHVVPAAESCKTMPAANNSSRMRSDKAKSRASLAALRCSIFS